VSRHTRRVLEETLSYICIPREGSVDVDIYEIETAEGYAAARRALAEAGIAQADVYVGEPDGLGDSYKNGAVVFACHDIGWDTPEGWASHR
jgi:hypothetical protein